MSTIFLRFKFYSGTLCCSQSIQLMYYIVCKLNDSPNLDAGSICRRSSSDCVELLNAKPRTLRLSQAACSPNKPNSTRPVVVVPYDLYNHRVSWVVSCYSYLHILSKAYWPISITSLLCWMEVSRFCWNSFGGGSPLKRIRYYGAPQNRKVGKRKPLQSMLFIGGSTLLIAVFLDFYQQSSKVHAVIENKRFAKCICPNFL